MLTGFIKPIAFELKPVAAKSDMCDASLGGLVLYLDADDTYHPVHLQRVFRLFRTNATIGYEPCTPRPIQRCNSCESGE